MLRGRPYTAGPMNRLQSASAVRLLRSSNDGPPGASHKVLFPSAYRSRAALDDTANIVRSRSGVTAPSAACCPRGRGHPPPLRFYAWRTDAPLFRRLTCATGTAGFAVARPSFPRRFAATGGSCAAGSFQNGGVPLPACGRHTAWSGAARSCSAGAPDNAHGIFALRSFGPARKCRDVSIPLPHLPFCPRVHLDVYCSRGRPSRGVFTHAGLRRLSHADCRTRLEGTGTANETRRSTADTRAAAPGFTTRGQSARGFPAAARLPWAFVPVSGLRPASQSCKCAARSCQPDVGTTISFRKSGLNAGSSDSAHGLRSSTGQMRDGDM